MRPIDINVSAPNQLSDVLRHAAQAFRESQVDLQACWSDESAGRVWTELAKILDRAADSADRAVKKHF